MDMKSELEKSQIGSRGYALSGIAIIAVSAWAVLGPFVGTHEAWRWTFDHVLLSVLPAAAAALGGLILLIRRGHLASVGGLLALAGGLWFIVGPMTYPLWSGGLGTGPAPGGSVWLAQWAGFLFVSGALITLLSSYALGYMAPVGDEVVEQQAGADGREPVTAEHMRRRPSVRQPAARRERTHAQAGRGRARHRS
jgi:hypothetical protein